MAARDDFFERVYVVVRQIPAGRVTSYGAIARAIGSAKASRTVGYAMNASHQLPDVPAHRVVNRQGLLTGKHYFGGLHAMQHLLEAEGIRVKDDQVQDFARHFWDPLIEGADLP
ncbi:MAG: MGMT family protein [Bacteroidetes bacterium]|nr:MAG: cysteine methyltransferase [Cryomorphaceae bacterium BACL23 MAG-120924-bin60]MBL6627280.1 MGMT family protein [Cryomorphaceae bacterium]MDA0363978.1 MGMT family protein [Bacteroidota bacterium]NDA06946.1 MGMT family protein [Flavobacteriia bacterium]MDA0828748.1 MGMT family protein [Bacteroidota bacterium]